MVAAVIFDMDGLLLDSEVYWERARREYAAAGGCRWSERDELDVKGMNSQEWAALIQSRCGFDTDVAGIIVDVSRRMRDLYSAHLPLLPGAVQAVRTAGAHYPLGLASSSPLELIQFAMSEAGIRSNFRVTVSSDEVGKGKPSPDVFLETSRRLGVDPAHVTVLEDSSAGIAAAHNAGMRVIAVPNPHYPPSPEALALADLVLPSLTHFSPDTLGSS